MTITKEDTQGDSEDSQVLTKQQEKGVDKTKGTTY